MARFAFCQDTLIEYMGYMQMAAVLREEGHTVEVFFDDQRDPERFMSELRRFQPDVVGFSVLTPSRGWAMRTGARVRRELGAITVVGNVDVILNPEIYAESGAFDLVCPGEGERSLSELGRRVDDGAGWRDIRGLWSCGEDGTRRNPAQDLVDMEALPLIDRSIYDKYRFFRHSRYLRVYAGRGCPFRCSFCANTQMTDTYGGRSYFRKRRPEQFVDDIVQLVASRPEPVKRIYIIDEVLWFDRRWLREFLELYRDRVGIPFVMNFKFNGGVSEDDVRLMGEAGAVAFVATETGNEDLRRGLLNKPVSNQHILQVAEWMHRHGVVFGSSAFFGLPGQSFEGHLAELDFFRKVRPKYLWTTFFQPYPGIALTEHPDVVAHIPDRADFAETLHHEMYLDLPDRIRLVNLKKVYFWMYRYPWTERPLAFLCRFRVPLLFDVLFAIHFLFFYALWAEGLTLIQLGIHVRNFAVNPFLRRRQTPTATGRPFDPGYGPRPPASPVLPAGNATDGPERRSTGPSSHGPGPVPVALRGSQASSQR